MDIERDDEKYVEEASVNIFGKEAGYKLKNLIIRPETKDDYYNAECMTKKAFWNLHHPGCDEHYLVQLLETVKIT